MILVTGGAGFIGSHLVDSLLARGHKVRVLDTLIEQVHGSREATLPEGVEIMHGDVRDRSAVELSLEGVDVVFHLAAEVGVGQSMYEIERYVSTNDLGTATLLQALTRRQGKVQKLIVASSMSIYGEGAYSCRECGPASPTIRPIEQLNERIWQMLCPLCKGVLEPVPTTESKTLNPTSVYAISKQDQEQYCLVVGRAYQIPTVALRYFNIYGPRQSLSNPYTGVMAIFSSRLLNDQPPIIFEDGLQSRDFTHVSDVVRANLLAMESDDANFQAINIGTGVATSVKRVAQVLAEQMGLSIDPMIAGKYREGDIRHCVADISLARKLLDYEPCVTLEQGIPKLLSWVRNQQAIDGVEKATAELETHGLVK